MDNHTKDSKLFFPYISFNLLVDEIMKVQRFALLLSSQKKEKIVKFGTK